MAIGNWQLAMAIHASLAEKNKLLTGQLLHCLVSSDRRLEFQTMMSARSLPDSDVFAKITMEPQTPHGEANSLGLSSQQNRQV